MRDKKSYLYNIVNSNGNMAVNVCELMTLHTLNIYKVST